MEGRLGECAAHTDTPVFLCSGGASRGASDLVLLHPVGGMHCCQPSGGCVDVCFLARGVQAYPDLEAQLPNLDTLNIEAEGWCSVVGFAC